MLALAVLLTGCNLVSADNARNHNARDAVEGYVAAALAGKVDDAMALAVEGKSPAKKKRIQELAVLVGAKTLDMDRVLASEKKGQAIAVSKAIRLTKANPDGRDTGRLVFGLVKSGNNWLVRDIDFATEERAKEKVKRFENKNADVKEIAGKGKK
jgi:hypothetical protein